ncbi:MAG: 50S ribosomal protein L13, partial [Lentisphaerae bacterium]|nr:50S ribosomal protein L13 [Lentisphaerota bacterium]
MKTFLPKDPGVNRDWIVVDVAGKPLGRAAVIIANALRGKCKPTFTPAVDTGDFVVVVNAAEVRLSGTKESKKIYQRYSGFRGGRKTFTAAEVRAAHPERMIEEAVSGMLPGNHLCRRMLTRLKI